MIQLPIIPSTHSLNYFYINPPAAEEDLIPRPLGRLKFSD